MGAGLGTTTGWALLQELQSSGVDFYTSLSYKEVRDEGLVIELKSSGEKIIECDTILVCAGQDREDFLANSYKEKHPEKQIFVIGGAKETSGLDAKRAILEGSLAAREIGVK